ncbi:hypothetical protein D3C75_1111520 [compost metagenome]
MQVFAGVDLVAQVDAGLFETIENRQPALGQFCKTLFDQTARPLRPRVEIRPEQRAGKGCMGLQPQPLTGAGRQLQLVDGPFGPRLRLTT